LRTSSAYLRSRRGWRDRDGRRARQACSGSRRFASVARESVASGGAHAALAAARARRDARERRSLVRAALPATRRAALAGAAGVALPGRSAEAAEDVTDAATGGERFAATHALTAAAALSVRALPKQSPRCRLAAMSAPRRSRTRPPALAVVAHRTRARLFALALASPGGGAPAAGGADVAASAAWCEAMTTMAAPVRTRRCAAGSCSLCSHR